MKNLIRGTDETSARARVDRSIQSGLVLAVDRIANRAVIDVGMVNKLGVPVYMVDVPFTPQNAPRPYDTVTVGRTNSSPYSHYIGGGAQVGGANQGQIVDGVGGISSNPTSRGQIMYSEDGTTGVWATPVVSSDFGIILTEDDTGFIIVADE